MKHINLRNLLLLDFLLLLLSASIFFWGPIMWESINSFPNKALYAEINARPDALYNITEKYSKINKQGLVVLSDVDQQQISVFSNYLSSVSETLYGTKLANNQDLTGLQKILTDMKKLRWIQGDRTFLGAYIGEAIKASSPRTKWAYQAETRRCVLINPDNNKTVDTVIYINGWSMGNDLPDVDSFYRSALIILGDK